MTTVLPNEYPVISISHPKEAYSLNIEMSVEVSLSLSCAMENLTPLGAHFTFDSDVVLVDLIPNHAPVAGGTQVKFVGGPFFQFFRVHIVQ